MPCRDVVLALMKKLPVLLDRTEGLPAALAERYTSTSQEVQDRLRENVSVFVEVQTACSQARWFDGQSENAGSVTSRSATNAQLFGSACIASS